MGEFKMNISSNLKKSLKMVCLNSISQDLRFVGIEPSSKGFSFLSHSILLCTLNPLSFSSLNGYIFSKVARIYKTDIETVHRISQHTIDMIYFNGKMNRLYKITGNVSKMKEEKPSLINFIYLLTKRNYVKLKKIKQLFRKKFENKKKNLILKFQNKLFSLNLKNLCPKKITCLHTSY